MKKGDFFLTTGFCAILSFFCLSFFIFPTHEFSENEKRVLQKAPVLSQSSLLSGKFFSSVDNYISDHFAARDVWIGLNAYFRQCSGLNAANTVYRGKDHWLIDCPVASGKTFDQNKETIAQFAEKTQIPMSLLCVPSTGYIMSDKLPKIHDSYPDESMLAELQDICTGQLTWVPVTNTLRSSFQTPFYRTDHHWTSYGAYRAYEVLCQAWGLTAGKQSEYTIDTYTGFYGTTYSKSGLWATPADSIELWHDNQVQSNVSVYDENKPFPLKQASPFFLEHLKQSDKYPVFLDGNHALTTITSDAPNGKLLIIRDSFAHCLAPFLSRHFAQIDLIDLRYFKEQTITEKIQQEHYDRILLVYGLASIAEDRSIQWLS